MKRNILLCVAGGTPAIITETLWALQERGERIDEIRVITTLEGREKILTGKINGRGAADQSLLDSEQGQFFKFIRDYPAASSIKFDANCLYLLTTKKTGVPHPRDDDNHRLMDILTDVDNERAANQICEIVRELSADEHIRIHASIAGGRKTMSLYLMTAMQLFGRNDDVMSHVLVSKEVESGAPKFFYKPPIPETILDLDNNIKTKIDGSNLTTEDVSIFLADITFIRLRGIGSELINQRVESYGEIVRQAQENLERFNLVFDVKRNFIKVGKREIEFSPADFFVYAMFAYLCKQGRGQKGFSQVDEISLADFDQVCRFLSRAQGNECGYQEFIFLREGALEKLSYSFFKESNPTRGHDFVLATVKQTLGEAVSTIKRKLKKANLGQEFAIVNARKNQKNVEPLYGLEIEPDRIQFQ